MYRLLQPALVVMFVCAALSAPALADPCSAGTSSFGDVLDSAGFCTNTQWMKNRGITLGCGNGTIYCPNDAVSRASMALFMNRLGTTLTPSIIHAIDHQKPYTPGDSMHGSAVCLSSVIAAANYPRTATISGFVSGANASSAMVLNGAGTMAVNGGVFSVLGEYALASVGTASSASIPASGAFAINAGQTAQVGVFLFQDGAATSATLEMVCDLVIRIENKNGTSPPF